MMNSIDQLMSLPELKDLKLIGGMGGTFNTVRWVHVVENSDILEYVQKDELIIMTGVALQGEKNLIEYVNGLIDKKASGLIINIGKYIPKVPQYLIDFANENNFPIFEIPWEINLADITKIICGDIVKRHLEESKYQDLLMNIIYSNNISFEDFNAVFSVPGNNLLSSFRILIIQAEQLDVYMERKEIKGEKNVLIIKDTFLRLVNSAALGYLWKPISFLQNDSVVLLLLNERERSINIKMLMDLMRECINTNLLDLIVNIGVGNMYEDYSQIRKSYSEAEKALKVIKAERMADADMFYSKIGVYKLLTAVNDFNLMKEYYGETVGKLEAYDMQNKTDFLNIIKVFLQENGNYMRTAQKLYMHKNTLMYKINKIQEILKQDFSDYKVRQEYYIGFLIKAYMDI